ncbi:MAG: hypothetical protein ABGX15_14815, partial [Paracoccaceae bacterium]
MTRLTPGARFRAALEAHRPLPIVGTINAYTALMADKVGHPAIYLSGGGVANALAKKIETRTGKSTTAYFLNVKG